MQVEKWARTLECASTTRRRGTKVKHHTVQSGLTTGRISGNVMHFRSVATQYTPQRFPPVARHIMRHACSCARRALLKATDRTVATSRFKMTRDVRMIVTVGRVLATIVALEKQ